MVSLEASPVNLVERVSSSQKQKNRGTSSVPRRFGSNILKYFSSRSASSTVPFINWAVYIVHDARFNCLSSLGKEACRAR